MDDRPVPEADPLGRLVQAADFERVLKAPSRARSPHFVVHHLATGPQRRIVKPAAPLVPELSTGDAPERREVVDNSPPDHQWLGVVVPKRHAKRAVTRALIKRQMRAAVARHAGGLPQGLWVLRLRSPFDPKQFPSARSEALRIAVRSELDTVLQRAAAR